MNAFVYCWTDHKENKVYVGSHKGSIDDGYICSSKYVREQIELRPTDFTRQIITEGEWDYCYAIETALLESVDARNNRYYYNGHNNSPDFLFKAHTTETKQKMSVLKKGKPGRQWTEEQKKAKSLQMKGKPSSKGMLGKKHSEEWKQIMSARRKGHAGAIFKHTPEAKEKIRQALLSQYRNGIR
jgi:NUMOD3 motif